MVLSVAGLRHFILASTAFFVLSSTSAAARDEILFTSSVSYCADPIALLVQQFDVTYFAANSSVFFNISASSVDPNINATANLLVNVYGMQLVNLTIDLCDQLSGALCPLPQYNFNGSEILPLPSGLDVAKHVPGIAYKIPDLEAFAQLTLFDQQTGEVKACVQSTLSNGWSTHQPGVIWATAGIALLALLSAIVHSIRTPEALAPFRFVDLMSLYQIIGTSALLDLNYPVVYRSFCSNFAWALGLVATGARSHIQQAINNMRHKTGGSVADANSGSAIDLVNRRFSPYNSLLPGTSAEAVGQVRLIGNMGVVSLGGGSVSSSAVAVASAAATPLRFVKRDVVTVTADSGNILQAGLPVFVNSLGVGTANGFMTVFFTVLFMLLIAGGVLGMGYLAIKVLRRRRISYSQKLEDMQEYYPWFARSWGLRLLLISFLPVTVFTFYQWTLKDSWLSVLLSVITFLSIASYLAYVTFRLFQMVRRDRPWTLYTHTPYLFPHGPLYLQYRHQRWYFFTFTLGAILMRGIIVGFASSNGLAQVILLLILELALLGVTVHLKPHETRGGDILAVTLAIARVVAAGLLIAFIPKLEVKPIPRVAIGIVAAVMFSVLVIVMFLNVLVNLGLKRVWDEKVRWKLGMRLGSGTGTTRGNNGGGHNNAATRLGSVDEGIRDLSGLEKGEFVKEKDESSLVGVVDTDSVDSSGSSSLSSSRRTRPRNPTPLQHIPLDPRLNEPYPETSPTSATLTASTVSPLPSSFLRTPTSAGTCDSGLGTVLPRRPEFMGLGLERVVGAGVSVSEEGGPGMSEEGGRMSEEDEFVSVPSTPAAAAAEERVMGGGGSLSSLSPTDDQAHTKRESWSSRSAHLPMESIAERPQES